MVTPPIYVSESDHAALVSEMGECSARTTERLDAQSRVIDRLAVTIRELEARLASLTS